MPSDARKLSDWLHRQPGALQKVLSHTEQLVQVNRAFCDWLREPWADSVRIASYDSAVAVIYAANASAATLLRFRAPAVIAWLQHHWNPDCTELKIKYATIGRPCRTMAYNYCFVSGCCYLFLLVFKRANTCICYRKNGNGNCNMLSPCFRACRSFGGC